MDYKSFILPLLSFLIVLTALYYEIKSNFQSQPDADSIKSDNPVNKNKDLTIITGIFLLVLAVCGNFIAETLGCKLQYHLSNNMFLKNLVIVMVVYFSLSFSDEENRSPAIHFQRSLLIWGFFLLFNKMTITVTGITFILLLVILIMKDYVDYYTKADAEQNQEQIILLLRYIEIIFFCIIFLVLFGFTQYFIKKYNEYKTQFNLTNFLFGKLKCRNSDDTMPINNQFSSSQSSSSAFSSFTSF